LHDTNTVVDYKLNTETPVCLGGINSTPTSTSYILTVVLPKTK